MYIKAEAWEAALRNFLDCQQWRQVFCMTTRLKYSSDMEADVARKLAGMADTVFVYGVKGV